jgi:hypothetical protein
LTYGALKAVGDQIAVDIKPSLDNHKKSVKVSLLVTNDPDLLTSDCVYRDINSGLSYLTQSATELLNIPPTAAAPEAERIASWENVGSAVAAAIPQVLSLLSPNRTIGSATITVEDQAATAAVINGILGDEDVQVYLDDFRLIQPGGIFTRAATLATQEWQLSAKQSQLTNPDDSATLASCKALISTIDSFLAAIHAVSTGAARSPLDVAATREQLHVSSGLTGFTHLLLVKAASAQAQQVITQRPLWLQPSFVSVVDVSVTYTLILVAPLDNPGGQRVLASSNVTGSAIAKGKVKDLKPETSSGTNVMTKVLS